MYTLEHWYNDYTDSLLIMIDWLRTTPAQIVHIGTISQYIGISCL